MRCINTQKFAAFFEEILCLCLISVPWRWTLGAQEQVLGVTCILPRTGDVGTAWGNNCWVTGRRKPDYIGPWFFLASLHWVRAFSILINLQLIDKVVLVSGVQQSDSGIHIDILFQILFHYRLLYDTEYSSLCYIVGSCWLSILYTVMCIR